MNGRTQVSIGAHAPRSCEPIMEQDMVLSVEPEALGTRAIAIAGMCLAIATLSQLRAKGALIDSDVYKIFEGTLTSLETSLGPADPAAQEARRLVALIHQTAALVGPVDKP